MIFQILYISLASVPVTPLLIKSIKRKASVNNPRDGLTGILLSNSNMFMQLIEGEEEKVKKKYERIKKDERHKEITLIYEGERDVRFFENWSLLCKDINHCDPEFINKIGPYFHEGKTLESPNELLEILSEFSNSFKSKKKNVG